MADMRFTDAFRLGGAVKKCLAAFSVLFLALCVSVSGQAAKAQDRIVLEMSKGILLPTSEVVESVFLSDTSIADANLSPTESVFLYGKSVGETSLVGAALDGTELFRYTVVVTHPLSEIRRSLGRRFPGQAISIESSRGSVMVTGVVATEALRDDVIATLKASIPDTAILNRLQIASSNLVRLRLQLLEINHSRAQDFGINLSGFVANNGFVFGVNNGRVNVGNSRTDQDSLNAMVNLLISNGVATIVQEAALGTTFGQEAEFLIGGEIPIPGVVSDQDAGNFGLDYKFVGTELKFTPTPVSGKKLALKIDSSMSVASQSSSQVNGNSFPNLTRRSFRTHVELEDQQSCIIMGLSKNETVAALRDSNGGFASSVANIFARDRVGQTRQELVVVITPMMAEPEKDPVAKALIARPSNLEYILSRRRGGKTPGLGRLQGNLVPCLG